MSLRAQVNLLVAVSMLLLLVGAVGGVGVYFFPVRSDSNSLNLTFTLVGILGLIVSNVLRGLVERVEHLEREPGPAPRAPSAPAGEQSG